ncbi:MAG: hypothetical protein HQK49_16580 [Oligoflexia bacterium]|nr:hypothetical protein [Oligoflexia bacterium]
MQNIIDIFLLVIEKLESENIHYMLVGSLAAVIYGEPRMTHDMDLVVDILPQDVFKFEKLFSIEEFYCPPKEILNAEIINRGQFNLIHQESGLKIDVVIRKATQHAKEEFLRRQKYPFWAGKDIYVATPEDIIIKKLVYYREGGSTKHLTDIRGILNQTKIDETYLNRWIIDLRLTNEWDQVNL